MNAYIDNADEAARQSHVREVRARSVEKPAGMPSIPRDPIEFRIVEDEEGDRMAGDRFE